MVPPQRHLSAAMEQERDYRTGSPHNRVHAQEAPRHTQAVTPELVGECYHLTLLDATFLGGVSLQVYECSHQQ